MPAAIAMQRVVTHDRKFAVVANVFWLRLAFSNAVHIVAFLSIQKN